MLLKRSTGCAVLAALLATAAPRSAHAEEPLRRHVYDERDVARLRREHPAALEGLERGEAALLRGDSVEAARLFATAATEAPGIALLDRRHCQALVELGRRDEALAACRRASQASGGSAIDLRAMVGALLSGEDLPTPLALGHALGFAERARESMPTQPYGYAALCDVAIHLGDEAMARRCLQDLDRVAPDHGETQRVRAWLAANEPSPAWGWLGWGALLAACAGTIVHALRRRLSLRRARGNVVAAAVAIVVGTSFSPAPTAHAQPAEPSAGSPAGWQIDDENPEASLPAPPQSMEEMLAFGYFLMELTGRAEHASETGDHAAAIRYFRALTKAVPDRAISYGRLCASYEAVGDREHALEACREAVTKGGVRAEDYDRLARLLLAGEEPVAAPVVAEIDATIQHLRAQGAPSQTLAHHLSCGLGARIRDEARLVECTTALAAVAPNDPKTITFQWALAMQQERFDEARQLVERATTAGVEPASVARMEQALTQATSTNGRLLRYGLVGFGALLLLAALIAVLARRTPSPKPA